MCDLDGDAVCRYQDIEAEKMSIASEEAHAVALALGDMLTKHLADGVGEKIGNHNLHPAQVKATS